MNGKRLLHRSGLTILVATIMIVVTFCTESVCQRRTQELSSSKTTRTNVPSDSATPLTRFVSAHGSSLKIEGTTTFVDWLAESTMIEGYIDVGPHFPVVPGQKESLGKAEARGLATIPVIGLKSIKPRSSAMDEIMHAELGGKKYPCITYHLGDLWLIKSPTNTDTPNVFEARGKLAIAGVTNEVSIPLNMLPFGGNAMKISGQTSVRMSRFEIKPREPRMMDPPGGLKFGDEVKVSFDWVVTNNNVNSGPAKNP